jgi:hypothetical protein
LAKSGQQPSVFQFLLLLDYIINTIASSGPLWIFDMYRFDGRLAGCSDEVGAFADLVHRAVDSAMSAKSLL